MRGDLAVRNKNEIYLLILSVFYLIRQHLIQFHFINKVVEKKKLKLLD
jgi:hypothetical protein